MQLKALKKTGLPVYCKANKISWTEALKNVRGYIPLKILNLPDYGHDHNSLNN